MRNPLAFPMQFEDGVSHIGMSLRDYFAAKAMEADIISMEGLDRRDLKDDCKKTATIAYAMADAMMEARKE